MALDWRETLRTLLPQFQARAARSTGLHHLFVEVADKERNKLSGPPWFAPFSNNIPVIDGKPQYGKWDVCVQSGLPLIDPGFRAVNQHEVFGESSSEWLVRDVSGVVRAVAVPMKLRTGYYCGQPSEEVPSFESLANIAATALAGSSDLDEHVFASELTDLFRKPRGCVRYIFGNVPGAPSEFISRGWNAGILQFQHGVLIDVPISERVPNASHWLLLLHRLSWRQIDGSGLRGERYGWDKSSEVALHLLGLDKSEFPEAIANRIARISKKSYYSVLGTKDAPLDLYLASVFAIQLLLAEMSTGKPRYANGAKKPIDYSQEEWFKRKLPKVSSLDRGKCEGSILPKVGILCATEVERESVLKNMRPCSSKRSVIQVFDGKNTVYLGRLGLTNIVLCMSAMGSSGRDASAVVTAEVISSWKLAAVIMVGIAFGRDPSKQEIGSVLIAEQIACYEPQRVGKNSSQDRGDITRAGSLLLNRFRNVIGWEFCDPYGRKCSRQTGLLLSGEKLVDNIEFKNELFVRYPAAIGGEMEGAGVAAAAERVKCEWIVVKSICDWGDGEKVKVHQSFAAAASVSLVEHVLNQSGVLDE